MENSANIFCIRHVPFKHVSELLEVLSVAESDPDKVTSVVPVFPKSGEVYVYTWDTDAKKEYWRYDNHRWKNNGTKKLPTLNPAFTKYYHVLLTDFGATTQFQRHAYMPLDVTGNKIIVHYTGDDTLSVEKKHVRLQCPVLPKTPVDSIVAGLPAQNRSTSNIAVIHTPIQDGSAKRKLGAPTEDVRPPKMPLGMADGQFQLNESLSKQPDKQNITWLENLRNIAFELEPFVGSICTDQEFSCVLASEEMLKEFDRVLDLDCPYSQLLSYSSVYLPCGYFVSTLMFRHLLFDGSPFIPVAHVLHKILLNKSGDGFLREIVSKIPRLTAVQGVIAVDPKISSGVEKYLSGAKICYSWSDIRKTAKTWIKSSNDHNKILYMNDIVNLLESKSEILFDRQLEALKPTWSEDWASYFKHRLERDIRTRAGRWRLEELGVYCSYSGVTPALSNPFETVTHSLEAQEPTNIEAATVVMALNHLHSYYSNQILLARTGQPSLYTLRKEFKEIIMDPEDVKFPEIVISIDKIVQMSIEQVQNGQPYIDFHSESNNWGASVYQHVVPDDSKTDGDDDDSLSQETNMELTINRPDMYPVLSDMLESEASEPDTVSRKVKQELMTEEM